MLTVLIRHKASKREYLVECDAVEWEHDKSEPNAGLLIVNVEGRSQHYPPSEQEEDYRDVFVMNSAGQTVMRHLL